MIISHKHKFIYIKTRKTASTSIELALSSICGEKDIITPISPDDEKVRNKLGYKTAQNYNIPLRKYQKRDLFESLILFKNKKFYNHMPIRQIKNYLDNNVFKEYFKFTIERNPFDKVVSFYKYVDGPSKYNSLYDFLISGGLKRMESFDLYTINSVISVDKIYKYEEMDYFINDISQRLSLNEKLQLPKYKAKASKKKSTEDILDKKSIEFIKIAFAREIQLMNY